VRRVRLHDGRHTAATLLLSEGVRPGVVMEILDHSQMRTTTDTYRHVMPALGKDAADRMGKALWTDLAPDLLQWPPRRWQHRRRRPFPQRETAWSNGWS
jgi:hypothetical protein